LSERVNEKEIICVICPNSCRLSVWRDSSTDEVQVTGYQCPRGKDYGIAEYTNPVRMLITTMQVEGGVLPVIPVRSTEAIPKAKIFEAIKIVNEATCEAPIKMGQILIKDIANTGIDVIASRDLPVMTQGVQACYPKYDESDLNDTLQYTLVEHFYGGRLHLSETERDKIESVKSALLERLKYFGLKTDL
jgi:CxxC motif-containing protein